MSTEDGELEHNNMTWAKLFPILLVICNIGAAAAYGISGDWKRALYWAASSICIVAVTF